MKIGIAKKLIGSFVIGTFLYAVTVVAAYLIMEDLLRTVNSTQALSKNVELTGNLQLQLNRLLAPMSGYLVTGDIRERDNYDRQIGQISAAIEELKKYKGGKGWQDSLEKVSSDTTRLGEMSIELLYMKNPVGNKAALRLMEEINAFSDHVIKGTAEFHRLALEEMRRAEGLARAKERRAQAAFFAILALSVAILPFLSLYLSRYVTRPLIALHEGVRAIGEGRLGHRIKVRTGDEIEALADGFNDMAVSLERAYEELKKHRDELAAANVRLKDMDRLKSEFLANMSHELRTPLTAIIGFSELLIDRVLGELNEEQAGCLENIFTSSQHLLKLINDILDLSKIEAGRMELHLETFRLEPVMEFAQKTMSPLVERQKQTLDVKVAGGIPEIYGDQGRIRQVLLNLLGNAIKFTPGGGAISVNARAEGGFLVLSVKDTGIGIRPEDRESIFEAFRQAEGTTTRGYGGTGLGLTLTKKLVEMHGGRIGVESEVGKGSTFTVYLPVKKT